MNKTEIYWLTVALTGTCIFCPASLGQNDDSVFSKPLFPQPLFSDRPLGARLDSDILTIQQQMGSASTGISPITNSAMDQELRRQMSECARYLLRYCIRNGNRFPGLETSDAAATRVQLAELLANNPYSYALNHWGESWDEQPAPQQLDRIVLGADLSLSRSTIENYISYPPDNWQAPPGTITCLGNSQGLFIVWGAGKDGKPIKNPSTGRIFLITGNDGLTR